MKTTKDCLKEKSITTFKCKVSDTKTIELTENEARVLYNFLKQKLFRTSEDNFIKK